MAALSAVTGLPAVESSALAATEEKADGGEPRLSHRRFYTMAPFTIPLLVNGEIGEQFTIVVALELADEDDRGYIAHAVPRIRNELYSELLNLVTFRRSGAQLPEVAVFKEQLLKVAQRVVGDKVKTLLVQQAFKSPMN